MLACASSAQPEKQETPRILVLGDSLSAAYGLDMHKGWVALLTDRLRQHNPVYNVLNASISGETTAGGRARLPVLLEEHQPDWLILELGGNDGLRGFPLHVTEQNLDAMVAMAESAGSRVLLLGIQLPPNYGATYTSAFTRIYEDIANRYKTALVPFFLEGVGGNTTLMQPDGIHPNSTAQPLLMENVWQILEPLLKNG